MNWITDYVRPKLDFFSRRTMPENLWVKDPESGEMVFHAELEANHFVVPSSGYHLAIRAEERVKRLMDEGVFERLPQPEVAVDPLKFRDERRYTDKLKENRTKTGEQDTIFAAIGRIKGQHVTVCVQDFKFMGGSLGMAAGEAIIKSMETAVARRTPYILFAASGGARMQEGILSLMQLPRTTVAVQMLKEAGLPYIVVLTNPTTGGVSASYAMLGDIHIAEPGALIGFAGPRVIEQTIREKLPPGFQRAEYLQEHGMVDMVVPRPQHRETLGNLLAILMKGEQPKVETPAVEDADEATTDENAAPSAATDGNAEADGTDAAASEQKASAHSKDQLSDAQGSASGSTVAVDGADPKAASA